MPNLDASPDYLVDVLLGELLGWLTLKGFKFFLPVATWCLG